MCNILNVGKFFVVPSKTLIPSKLRVLVATASYNTQTTSRNSEPKSINQRRHDSGDVRIAELLLRTDMTNKYVGTLSINLQVFQLTLTSNNTRSSSGTDYFSS